MIDYAAIGAVASQHTVSRRIHEGRVCQADADIFAYDYAFLDESVSENWKRLKAHIDWVRRECGSQFINLHLTMNLKGGRFEIAVTKPYQENRSKKDPAKQARVWELRQLMAEYRTPNTCAVAWYHQEADDGMIQYQLKAIGERGIDASILFSADKDIWMGWGLHCCPRSLEIFEVKGFGKAFWKDVGNTKPKLLGKGVCWFWHQMIMGDKADNIPGLPTLVGKLAEKYLPLQKPNPKRKPLQCGPAKAVAILNGVTSEQVAMNRVAEAYHLFYGVGWREKFVEQAFLLWMRRTDDELDVIKYLSEVARCNSYFKLTKQQQVNLTRFMQLKQTQPMPVQTNAF